METTKQKIEFPKAVQLVAAVLIAKPLMDILMLQLAGAQNFTWIGWVLLFSAGISLLIRHRTAWILSIFLCVAFGVSTGIDFIREFSLAEPLLNITKAIDCLLVILVVGTVAYYFRYPYIDRRQGWLAPTAERFSVKTPVLFGELKSFTSDISYTGARLLNNSTAAVQVGEKRPFQFEEIPNMHCLAKVIAVQGQHIHLQFEGLSSTQTQLLRHWLSTRTESKA